jgi:hypothetical protein
VGPKEVQGRYPRQVEEEASSASLEKVKFIALSRDGYPPPLGLSFRAGHLHSPAGSPKARHEEGEQAGSRVTKAPGSCRGP